MKELFLKKRKFWWRAIALILLLPILLMSALGLYLYSNQDDIIQNEIAILNTQFDGFISVGDTHLSLLQNFPELSFKIDDVRIYESKKDNAPIIIDVEDIFLGFNMWDIANGNYTIKSLLVENGFLNIIVHKDGTLNIQNALTSENNSNTDNAVTDIYLNSIQLRNLDIHKLDEKAQTDLETFVHKASGGFVRDGNLISSSVDTEFTMNLIDHGDTTYIHNKHFKLDTDVSLDQATGILTINPSDVQMEHGDFKLEGTVDTKHEVDLDLTVNGTKPNFDMLIAFAPSDLVPLLERYQNAGKIYFNAVVKGPTLYEQAPFIDVQFGADEAFLENTERGKRVKDLGFKGHFTNGSNCNLRTMQFSIEDISAQLEEGNFLGSVVVTNFEEPEVDMEVTSNFNLEFMAGFLNLSQINDVSGEVSLAMNFHDIIDIDHPEVALNNLDRAYYSELKVRDLSLSSEELPAPLEHLNAHVSMIGKEAIINQFDLVFGKSDVSLTGFLSDIPAILHHTDTPVKAHLEIESNNIDIAEITKYSQVDGTGIIGVNEQVKNLSLGLSFTSSAKAFTESAYLPKGEFFVDSLNAQLKHYPHKIHDFHADILIEDEDLNIVDFTGFIDDSDFHFNGNIHDYKFWMQEQLDGNVDLDITLTSDLLQLEDIFAYRGENYVPKEYRHEEFENLSLHLNSSLHYDQSKLQAIDIDLDRLDTKMLLHPMRFQDFEGHFHYEQDHLSVENFMGKMGRTVFDIDLNYFLGKDERNKKRDNYLDLAANYIDYDQLFNFDLASVKSNVEDTLNSTVSKKHEEAFNLYELPFTDMKFNVNVDHFIHNKIDLQNIIADLRTTKNHFIHVDTLMMKAAGGDFRMSGYFNGSDPKNIYLKPNLVTEKVAIDKLLFKMENFGQDHLVSENLKGLISSQIEGNIKVYPDLVPDLSKSQIQIDLEVLNGQLQNYEPMLMLSDYVGDKNLRNVRFDTLRNRIDIHNGHISIPNMTIESTIGHMDISGSHDINQNIEYYLSIPWKTVKKAARYKLFSKKNKDGGVVNQEKEEDIIELDSTKKVRYLNLKIHGSVDDYKISVGKKKKE